MPDHPIFIDDLLAGPLVDGRLSPTQLDAQLGRGPDGLMVAPAPTDPERAEKLDEAAYRTLFARLSELVGTLVLDCGTGLDDPPARAALACADQLVLVCDDEPDTASIVSEAAEWLRRIEPPLVLVVNNVRRSSRIDVAALERERASRTASRSSPATSAPPCSCTAAASPGTRRRPAGRHRCASSPRSSHRRLAAARDRPLAATVAQDNARSASRAPSRRHCASVSSRRLRSCPTGHVVYTHSSPSTQTTGRLPRRRP